MNTSSWLLVISLLMSIVHEVMAGSCVQSSGSISGCKDIGGKCENIGGVCFQGLDETCCCSEALEECEAGQPLGGRFETREDNPHYQEQNELNNKRVELKKKESELKKKENELNKKRDELNKKGGAMNNKRDDVQKKRDKLEKKRNETNKKDEL